MRAFLILALSLLAVDAQAQTIVINPRQTIVPIPARAQRVTIAITIVNTMPSGSGVADMTAGFTSANQSLYSVVDHQCDVLAPLLHGDCRLVQMSTNGNSNEASELRRPTRSPDHKRHGQRNIRNRCEAGNLVLGLATAELKRSAALIV